MSKKEFLLIGLFASFLLNGCIGKNPVPTPFQPIPGIPYSGVDIISHIPLANVTNVATNLSQIRVTFNSNMSSANLNLITLTGPGNPTFSSTIASNKTLILNLNTVLRPSMTYKLQIPGTVQTVNGTSKGWSYNYQFTTVDAPIVHGTMMGPADKIYVLDGQYKRVTDSAYGPYVHYRWAGSYKDIVIADAPVHPIVRRFTANVGETMSYSKNYGTKASTNLSAFSNGYIIMWYKTALVTDLFMELTADGQWPGRWLTDFGWTADDQWHKLVIPVSAYADPPYNLNLSLFQGYYEFTGAHKPSGVSDYIYINSLYWSMTTN